MVLAVNYFGVRDGRFWDDWQRHNPGAIVVEDHTHDPVSDWALHSKADFAFSSLRKTLPVSDGAILWSPAGRQLPTPPEDGDCLGSSLKFAAMVLKKKYLEAPDPILKVVFRSLQMEGESCLTAFPLRGLSSWSRALLAAGLPRMWRERREENVRCLLASLRSWQSGTPLFARWHAGQCPFNGILLCSSPEIREELRTRLLAADVYPAVHWPAGPGASRNTIELCSRILTIPVDQRYDTRDVERIAGLVKSI
jgi:hypothetical protein